MNSTNNRIHTELHKLTELPPWGRPQGNHWDGLSRFIYRTDTLDGVRQQAGRIAAANGLDQRAFEAYAIHRWYNFHTHNQILRMILAHPEVTPEPNRKHHSIDFYLRGLPFDLKISRFPRAYPLPFDFARQQPHHLAQWQYENQSKQGRYHTGNRFFIILHHAAQPELVWQVRRDFEALHARLNQFLSAPTLLGLTLPNQPSGEICRPWAVVLFCVAGE